MSFFSSVSGSVSGSGSGSASVPKSSSKPAKRGYGGSNITSDTYGRDTTNTGSFEHDRLNMSQDQSETLRSSNINPTTEHQYGQNVGIGQYDSSLVSGSGSGSGLGSASRATATASNATTGHYTTTTGAQPGQGIHAPQFNTLNNDPDIGVARTTVIQDTGLDSGERFQCRECGLHVSEVTDQAHCSKCSAIRSGKHIGTNVGVAPDLATHTRAVEQPTQRAPISNEIQGDTRTTTHTGPSPYHLKPGETIIEKETRVHTGLSPSERGQFATSSTGNTTSSSTTTSTHPGDARRKSSLGEKLMGKAGKKPTNEEVPRPTGHTIN